MQAIRPDAGARAGAEPAHRRIACIRPPREGSGPGSSRGLRVRGRPVMMGDVTRPTPLHFETRAVTGGRPPARPDQPLNGPVTLASTYIAGGELEYGRYANPSWTAFEDVLGDLEGGRCLAFASGMAASAAVL